MDRKAAKELLHIQGWLERVEDVVEHGKDAYLADDLLQEARDSLMLKLGEAANDEINRAITWETLVTDLPAWNASLAPLFHDPSDAIEADDVRAG